MLTRLNVQRYKSLFDVTVDFEPITVFIGPNGSGKSNICEALLVISNLVAPTQESVNVKPDLSAAIAQLTNESALESKYWRGEVGQVMEFSWTSSSRGAPYYNQLSFIKDSFTGGRLDDVTVARSVAVYDFAPHALAHPVDHAGRLLASGQGVATALAEILFDDREKFMELEQHLLRLVPHVSRISLKRENNQDVLRLIDKYSDHVILSGDISDGTLRLLGFLTSLYQVEDIDIVCFEEPENGIHPWLLHKLIELLNQISQKGIRGKPKQIVITTHSPVLLNYVKPEQVRAVELDDQGATQVHALPVDSKQFRAALEAYDGELGELWFTNLFGGNPT